MSSLESLEQEAYKKLVQNCKAYATSLAQSLHKKHFKQDAPDWKPLPDLLGLLTQIDNMTNILERPSSMVQRECQCPLCTTSRAWCRNEEQL